MILKQKKNSRLNEGYITTYLLMVWIKFELSTYYLKFDTLLTKDLTEI